MGFKIVFLLLLSFAVASLAYNSDQHDNQVQQQISIDTNQTPNSGNPGNDRYLKIASFGRIANFGDIYDERSDQFITTNVFTSYIPDSFVRKTDVQGIASVETAVPIPRKFEDKLNLLKTPNLDATVNILAGLTTVSGTADFILNSGKSHQEHAGSDTGSGILLLRYTNVVEDAQILFEGVKHPYNEGVLQNSEFTHIVSRVTWGVSVALLFHCDAPASLSHPFLKAEFQNIQNGKLAFQKKDNTNNISCSVSIQSDPSLPNQKYTNLTQLQVQKFIFQLPSLIKEIPANEGKGSPLEFGLTPLTLVKRNLGMTPVQNVVSEKIPDKILENIPAIFQTISNSEEALRALQDKIYTAVLTVGYCVQPSVHSKIDGVLQTFINSARNVKNEIKECIIQTRSNSSNVPGNLPADLSELTSIYSGRDYEFSTDNSAALINEFKGDLDKIDFCTELVKDCKGIEYIGGTEKNAKAIFQNYPADTGTGTGTGDGDKSRSKVVYVLFIKSQFFENDSEETDENVDCFTRRLYKPSNVLFVLDCDFEFKECAGLNQTVIKQIRNGQFTIENVNDKFKNGLYQSEQATATVAPDYSTLDGDQNQIQISQQTVTEGSDYDSLTEEFTDYNFIPDQEESDLKKQITALEKVLNETRNNIETLRMDVDHTAQNHSHVFHTLQLVDEHLNQTMRMNRDDIDGLRSDVNQRGQTILDHIYDTRSKFEEKQEDIDSLRLILGGKANQPDVATLVDEIHQEIQLNFSNVWQEVGNNNQLFYTEINNIRIDVNQCAQNTAAEIDTRLVTVITQVQTCNEDILALRLVSEYTNQTLLQNIDRIDAVRLNLSQSESDTLRNFNLIRSEADERDETTQENISQLRSKCEDAETSIETIRQDMSNKAPLVDLVDIRSAINQNTQVTQQKIVDTESKFNGKLEDAKNDIENTLTGVNQAVQDNSQTIGLLRAKIEAPSPVKLSVEAGDIQLGCGGLIQIPNLPSAGGSIIVEYKSTEMYDNNERCLWTLDTSNGQGVRHAVRLEINLLYDGCSDSGDVLSAIAWQDSWDSLNTRLITKEAPTYMSQFRDFQFLSFTSNNNGQGTGFRARIRVIGVQKAYSGFNWAYPTTSGSAIYGPHRINDRIAVAVNPLRAIGQTYTLSVDYVESRKTSYCSGDSSLYLFEVGEKGACSKITSLCGISRPVTYNRRNPILALYVACSHPSGRGFKISWG